MSAGDLAGLTRAELEILADALTAEARRARRYARVHYRRRAHWEAREAAVHDLAMRAHAAWRATLPENC